MRVIDRVVRDTARIAAVQQALFGSFPCERYLFLNHIGAGLGGGTEHVNSTILQFKPTTLLEEKQYRNYLSLVSHEYFHTWNVKNFRPRGLKPYSYQRENYTKLLWIAEGTTSYYDELLCVRAGVWEEGHYLESLADLIYTESHRVGALVQSLEASSFDAWIKFNKPTPDSPNSTVSFYTKGALVNFLLDAHIRRASGGTRSLDDLMRALNQRFPLGSPDAYDTDSVLAILHELTGQDMSGFFDKYVRGTAPIDAGSALAYFGLEWKPREKAKGSDSGPPGKEESRATLGVELRDTEGAAVVTFVRGGGPASDIHAPEQALLVEDQIVAVNGIRAKTADLEAAVRRALPGERVALSLFRRERLMQIDFALGEALPARLKLGRVKDPSPEQVAAYQSWLGQKWPGKAAAK